MTEAETNAVQGSLDQIDIAKRLTKYAHRVPQPEEIPRFVAHAFRTALAGAPGNYHPSAALNYIFNYVLIHMR
jgi:thiamine pyrophosphate-dependent acetolactate synthase large subunit-like protein